MAYVKPEGQRTVIPNVTRGPDWKAFQGAMATATYRGQTDQVPRSDQSHSAEVMQMLSLLVTLSKVQGALPTSPAVLLK